MPRVTGPIAVTAASRPLAAVSSAQTVIDFPTLSYTEEEFFISGTANVYDWDASGLVSVKTPDAPYSTRILVRRPNDPAKFSGTVIVELMNPSRVYDYAPIWANSNEYFISHGDTWIGLTFSPITIAALKKFDPQRYGSLSMANPLPPGQVCAEPTGPGGASPDTETGLEWDIISQLGALLKSNLQNRPLAGFRVEYVYATAHTGMDLPTYITAIHPLAVLENGKPAYDGYLIKDSGTVKPLNQCGAQIPPNDPRIQLPGRNVPVIRFLTESFVLSMYEARRPDSDAPNGRFRLYELPASSHITKKQYNYLPSLEDQAKVVEQPVIAYWPNPYQCVSEIGLPDFPLHYFLNGAFANLDLWVRNGTPPPHALPVEVVNGGTKSAAIVRDEFGNPKGGIRSPYLDFPTSTYHDRRPVKPGCPTLPYTARFSWSKLDALYGNFKSYAAKVGPAIGRLVKERWVTDLDAQQIRAELLGARVAPPGLPKAPR